VKTTKEVLKKTGVKIDPSISLSLFASWSDGFFVCDTNSEKLVQLVLFSHWSMTVEQAKTAQKQQEFCFRKLRHPENISIIASY